MCGEALVVGQNHMFPWYPTLGILGICGPCVFLSDGLEDVLGLGMPILESDTPSLPSSHAACSCSLFNASFSFSDL